MNQDEMEYAIFRRSDGENGTPIENLRYTTKSGAQEAIDSGYAHPSLWEVRGRFVGKWGK